MLKSTASMKFFEPCYKHYLTQNVRSKLARVAAPEWEIATFLPMAVWEKASPGKVYRDSRRALRG